MDNRRGIVLRIFTDQRIFHNGFPQIAFRVTLTHALVDGILNRLSLKMNILPHFQKDNCHSGILTDR